MGIGRCFVRFRRFAANFGSLKFCIPPRQQQDAASQSQSLCEGYSPIKRKYYSTVLRKNQRVFAIFSKKFGFLVVKKRYAIIKYGFCYGKTYKEAKEKRCDYIMYR